MMKPNAVKINFFVYLVFFSNITLSITCDEGDFLSHFDEGLWQLDLYAQDSSNNEEKYEFLFTFDQKDSNTLKLSKEYKFPKVGNSQRKRHYHARKISLEGGSTDESQIIINSFTFKQTNEWIILPIDGQNYERFCIYRININAKQQSSSQDTSQYNAKFRLSIRAKGQQQIGYRPYDIEPTSYLFEYNDIPNENDKLVRGSLKLVQYLGEDE